MAVPTVFIVGVERLPLVPKYLNLGSVVVVAPNQSTLRRWVGNKTVNRNHPRSATANLSARSWISRGGASSSTERRFR
jgi:hypothetical protein